MKIRAHSFQVERAYINLKCLPYTMKTGERNTEGHCDFRLRVGAPGSDGAGLIWGWDGNSENPTITPSIQCQSCGLHVVISRGVENGRAPTPTHEGER